VQPGGFLFWSPQDAAVSFGGLSGRRVFFFVKLYLPTDFGGHDVDFVSNNA
jgi:hypothetical protein